MNKQNRILLKQATSSTLFMWLENAINNYNTVTAEIKDQGGFTLAELKKELFKRMKHTTPKTGFDSISHLTEVPTKKEE
ncbi:hypothetical protein [Tenacibaculum phage Larrie]|nr:hypothetical protein [Tenacibaculum phage Larrie]